MNAPLLLAVFGHPVAHSRSPAMHGAALRALGIPGRYFRFDVPPACLRNAVAMVRAAGFRGVNLTIPLKEAAFRIPGIRPTHRARLAGAINTLTFGAGAIEGDSTDGRGFLRSLADAWPGWTPRGRRVVLLGAGGAAKSVGHALAEAGAAGQAIWNRTTVRAARLARSLRGRAHPVRPESEEAWRALLASADLLVNATAIGMQGGPPPVPPRALHRGLRVADLVYSPPVTPLLAAARRAGCRTVNGEGMLVHQGALALERWTGVPAPVEVMRRALRRALRLRGRAG